MTALNLDGKTEEEVRDSQPGETNPPKKRGGRPKTNSKRSDADRAKDRERYHERQAAGRAAQQPQAVKSSMKRVLDRLVERQEARGDIELANSLREDGEMMASTVQQLVKLLPVVGGPLLMFFGLVEPFLAFGRTAGILRRRLLDRRMAAAEAEAQVQEEAAQPTPPGTYPGNDAGEVFA